MADTLSFRDPPAPSKGTWTTSQASLHGNLQDLVLPVAPASLRRAPSQVPCPLGSLHGSPRSQVPLLSSLPGKFSPNPCSKLLQPRVLISLASFQPLGLSFHSASLRPTTHPPDRHLSAAPITPAHLLHCKGCRCCPSLNQAFIFYMYVGLLTRL